jgi:hypothetical protein
MKQKLRHRLATIERIIKELTKKVRALELTPVPVPEKDDENKAKGDPGAWGKPKEVVKAAHGKSGKRTTR